MFFKKKEKPVREYNLFDIGSKAIYTQTYNYFPINVTYYKDRIAFCIERFNDPFEDGPTEKVSFDISVPLSEERLLSLEIDGETLFWDTQDMAFRKKVMPEGEPEPLIPPVLIYPNEVLTMEREFAEKELSPLALSYATLHEDKYIWYYPDGSITPAIFEIPRLFSVFNNVGMHPLSGHFIEVTNLLATFAPSYVEANGLTAENIYARYKENLKHGANDDTEKPE